MNTYEAKQEARRERYEKRAERASERSAALQQASSDAVAGIPFGQPILVGHHSEGRHRRTLARSHKQMDRAVAERDKAEYYERKAASVGKGGISGDDPEAIDKLKAKLAKLEALQETMKRVNRQYKKGGWDAVQGLTEATKAKLQADMNLCPWHGKPFPSYRTSNNNANMRRIKERIKELEAREETQPAEPRYGNGYTIREDAEDNRIRFEFGGKPPQEVRKILKSCGWRWSPQRGAWVRHLNNAGRASAQWVAQEIEKHQTIGTCEG